MQQHPYYDQLLALVQWQAAKIAELESMMKQMKEQFDQMSQRRTVHVDNIEYNFDQLKIETLQGTLNIGISPAAGGKNIEDLTVDGKELDLQSAMMPNAALLEPARDTIDLYLASDAAHDLMELEQKHHMMFGTDYRNMIILDIRNQMDSRLQHYLRHANPGIPEAELLTYVCEKVKCDIREAMEQHIVGRKQSEREGSA